MSLLAQRLKQLRATKKITQKELAEHLQFRQSNIAKWEISKGEPTIESLIRLAEFFNVSIDYLVGKTEFIQFEKNNNLIEVFPQEKILIAAYRQLPPSQQVMICRQLGIVHESELQQYIPAPFSKEA